MPVTIRLLAEQVLFRAAQRLQRACQCQREPIPRPEPLAAWEETQQILPPEV